MVGGASADVDGAWKVGSSPFRRRMAATLVPLSFALARRRLASAVSAAVVSPSFFFFC